MDPDHAAGEQLPYLETFSKAAELSNFTGAGKALRKVIPQRQPYDLQQFPKIHNSVQHERRGLRRL